MRTTIDCIICGGGMVLTNPKRDALIGKKDKVIGERFQRAVSGIAFKPEFSWTGVFGSTTTDGLPLSDLIKITQQFFALGFGGNGIVQPGSS